MKKITTTKMFYIWIKLKRIIHLCILRRQIIINHMYSGELKKTLRIIDKN